jgi:hypothetical protein
MTGDFLLQVTKIEFCNVYVRKWCKEMSMAFWLAMKRIRLNQRRFIYPQITQITQIIFGKIGSWK